MASAVVGALRVILSADTAEFDTAMKRVAGSANAWSKDLGNIGRQATAVGSALTRTLTLPLVGIGIAAVKAASDFESSFAGVRKTVNATEPEFAALAQGLRDMSKEIPVNVNELNKVAEAAGQLGIKKEDILQFTRTMADLGVTTNLTADEAATATAQIQNIFGAAGKDVDRFGSTLVALGNAGASTEKDIIEMGKRIAGAGNQVGLTQAQVLGFASALSSVGINAEAGGSAISRVFLKINDAVSKGGADMKEFARIAGMTGPAFKEAFETDAAGATTAFIAGLGRLKKEGENVNATLEGVVGKNIILKDTLLRASGAGQLLTDQLNIANKAWQDNTALTKEAAERYKTFESQLKVLWNQVHDVAITLGTSLLPVLKDLIAVTLPLVQMLGKAAEMFSMMPEPIRLAVVGVAALVAAIGPLLWLFGSIVTSVGTVIGAFGKKGIAMRALTVLGKPLIAAIGLVGTSFVAIGALAVAGAAALYQVGKAFVDLYKHWRDGKPMWDFFSARDEDNFVRRWLGLSTGAQEAATAVDTAADALSDFVGPMQEASEAHSQFAINAKASAEASKEAAAAAKKAHEERLAQLKAAGALEEKIREENAKFRAEAIAGIEKEKAAWRDYYNWLGERRMEDDARNLPIASTMDLSKTFEGFKAAVAQNVPNVTFWTKTFAGMNEGLGQALGNIPQTLANAFTGGGDIMGAVKSIVSQVGSAVGAGIGFAFGGPLGEKIGAAVGSMAGLLVAPLKKLFGIGLNDEIKKFNKEIEKNRQELLKTYGSLERIDRLGKAVGVDLAGAWQSQGEAGKKHFEQLANDFAAAVGKMESELEGFQDELSDTFEDARELGYILDKDGKLVSVRFEAMQKAAEEFGVDLQSLGPSFQGARLAADAGKIINAFDLLAKGGTDAGTILFGMRDEISQLVNDSIQFKTTIPENMRPWIAELIRAGLLVDDNGEKITDIGLIKFGPAVETQFEGITRKIEGLITKIDELITILTEQLKPAIDDATRPVPAPWEGWVAPDMPVFDGFGGGVPSFASGTRGFANFGAGMPAILHGMEAVVPQNQAVPFAMDVLSGLNQQSRSTAQTPTPINVRNLTENRIILDGTEMKRWISDQITTAIENNERGLRSRFRDGLGVTT